MIGAILLLFSPSCLNPSSVFYGGPFYAHLKNRDVFEKSFMSHFSLLSDTSLERIQEIHLGFPREKLLPRFNKRRTVSPVLFFLPLPILA